MAIRKNESDLEKKFKINVLKNAHFCKKFYLNIYDCCTSSFKEFILSSPPYIVENIIKEMESNWCKLNKL